MKHNPIILMTLLLGLTLFGCKKYEPEKLTPKITEDKVETTATTATFTWTVDWLGKLISVVEVSEHEDMSDSQFYGSETETENYNFTVTVTGLKEATKYYYRYIVWNKYYVDNKFEMEENEFIMKTIIEPTIITTAVKVSTSTEAIGGGDVTDDGWATIIERGICWGTSHNPDISNGFFHLAESSTGLGNYSVLMTGLTANTVYYVRAYAINSLGINYGSEVSFKTPLLPPDGAIDGLFTVAPQKQVFFSQGNLQYQASTNIWRFAEYQWDFVGTHNPPNSNYPSGGTVDGSDNYYISQTYSGWIDLFGWGTSGWDSGNVCYHPWDTCGNGGAYVNGHDTLYGPPRYYDLVGEYANADWGIYNPISNGGDQTNLWRTLTSEEWYYLIHNRSTPSGMLFAMACVNDVNGVILLPDGWINSYYILNNTNVSDASFNSNIISALQWRTLEQHGAVFLPAAGWRVLWSPVHCGIVYINECGSYWSSTHWFNDSAYELRFESSYMLDNDNSRRSCGRSVRLVHNVE